MTDPAPAVAGTMLDPDIAALLKRDPAGLVTAVIQEERTGEVLMVGWMDDVALHKTLTTGRSTFFSPIRPGHVIRSRRRVLSINERTGRFGLTLYVEMERELVDQHGTVLRTDVDTIVRH